VLQPIRRAAARTIKPKVSEQTWAKIRRLDPRKPNLTRLASQFGTDKWGRHRYAPVYERHFKQFRNDPISLLEIGIGGYSNETRGGASLRMWEAYFPKAQIIGLDIHDKSFVNSERIRAYQGSQTDARLLREISRRHGKFKIIIDDGSHRPEHIRKTFKILFPLLANRGLYVIEDTQTSYWPRFGGKVDLDDKTTTMALVKSLLDGLNHKEFGKTTPRSYSDAHVVAVHCYHNLVIIEKGLNDEPGSRPRDWNQTNVS
jgi:hypothetical protein